MAPLVPTRYPPSSRGGIRPAASIVVVEALIEPTLLVEIEAEAHR